MSPYVLSLTGQSEADLNGGQSQAFTKVAGVRGFGVGGGGGVGGEWCCKQSTLLLTGDSREISCFKRSGVFLVLKYSIHSSLVSDNCSNTSSDKALAGLDDFTFRFGLKGATPWCNIRSGLTLFGRSRTFCRGAGLGAKIILAC